ncbi:hypothetical protein AB0U21_23485, partial [Escherichia coli]
LASRSPGKTKLFTLMIADEKPNRQLHNHGQQRKRDTQISYFTTLLLISTCYQSSLKQQLILVIIHNELY